MFKKSSPRHNRRLMRPSNAPCHFCTQKIEPAYKDIATIERFTTDRGKIVARSRSGLCRQHQRLVTVAIKRARHLALLPFIPTVK